MLMPRASHAFRHSQFHLPISHTVDSIGGCEGLRKHLKKVEDIMHRGVSHTGENTHILNHMLLHTQHEEWFGILKLLQSYCKRFLQIANGARSTDAVRNCLVTVIVDLC